MAGAAGRAFSSIFLCKSEPVHSLQGQQLVGQTAVVGQVAAVTEPLKIQSQTERVRSLTTCVSVCESKVHICTCTQLDARGPLWLGQKVAKAGSAPTLLLTGLFLWD